MKLSVLFLFTFLFSFSPNSTVETYDWSTYEAAAKKMNASISKMVEAHIIIQDNLELNVELLPQKTKSQLTILQDAAYLEWLVAEDQLGKDEASKYWDKYKSSKDLSESLKCYEQLEMDLVKHLRKMYVTIAQCDKPTRTACHLEVIQSRVDFHLAFYSCIADKYGDWGSPLKPRPVMISNGK